MRQELLKIFSHIPTLETERLILRRMTPHDAADMYDYAHRPEVSEYLLWSPHESVKASKNYLSYLQTQYAQRNFYDWAIVLGETGKMIGTVGFSSFDIQNNSAEIGYVLNPDFWHRGIAPEALRAVMEFGFRELSLHRLEVRIMTENEKSKRVAEKCGFSHEATMRDKLLVKGIYRTIDIYSILASEYFK